MFYQIPVPENDINLLRSLWSDNHDSMVSDFEMIIQIFEANYSPSCSYNALKTVALDTKEKYEYMMLQQHNK